MEAKAARAPEKKQEHLLFPLMIGQSVGLDARFGDQIASLMSWLSQIAHPRRGGESRSSGLEVARGRDELTLRKRYKATFYRCQPSPLTKIKKMLKMKGGPNKLMKTNGQISDKMAEAIKYLKTQ